MARVTLEDWIREAVADGDPEHGLREAPVSAFSLVHMRGESEVEMITISLNRRKYEASEIADIIERRANAYAQDLEGPQTFQVHAFYRNPKDRSSHPFVVIPDKKFSGLSSEGPHSTGLTQQAMRHTEAMAQIFIRQSATLFDSSQKMIEALSRSNEKLMHENIEAFEIVKELLGKKSEEQHRMEMAKLENERKLEDRKNLMKMLPPLVNTVLGKQVFPQSTADTALIETIVSAMANVPQEDLMLVIEKLKIPAEVLAPLMARANEVMAQRQEEQAKLRQLSTIPVANPEENAAGG